MAAAAIKMEELLVSWLGNDDVFENVCSLIETYKAKAIAEQDDNIKENEVNEEVKTPTSLREDSPQTVTTIPPFYPQTGSGSIQRERRTPILDTWELVPDATDSADPVRDLVHSIYGAETELSVESFGRITKEVCQYPTFFNGPLYQRILDLWNAQHNEEKTLISIPMMEWFWLNEMEPYDASDRFFNLIKQPNANAIVRDDFLPLIKALLATHPGLEFLSSHIEFQEKYAVTVITRIFYVVNRCNSGRITARQIRKSDLLETFWQAHDEEDINKVTRYLSYEHFYVLYCRFWELDNDRDYRITRDDLLKYGDHSLSHMIVDRIFDAAPRPFDSAQKQPDYLSYEDFIYFMLSEEDKSNEISVNYWFACLDVDGDGKLNNMEMRSFYAVQLHRMTCMGHETVPFEDMLCQMMDMIKPAHAEYLVPSDFTKESCALVSGALLDALFNLNKYLMFEQRDPFVERQKREDEFECDWDRFACIDYNRLAMEEEAREEEAMEIDWVTVDDDEDEDEDDDHGDQPTAASSEAPF